MWREYLRQSRLKHPWMPEAAIMCVKLDSCYVNSFYHFDKYTALKIENGIATLPISEGLKLYDLVRNGEDALSQRCIDLGKLYQRQK